VNAMVWLTIFIITDENDPILLYTRRVWDLSICTFKSIQRIGFDDFKKQYGITPSQYIDSLPHLDLQDSFDLRHNDAFPDFPNLITRSFADRVKNNFVEKKELVALISDNVGKYVVGFYQ
jgi:hypothetical protein